MTYKLTGEIEIHKREIDSDGNVGPVIEVQKATNLLTDVLFTHMSKGGVIGPNIVISSDTAIPSKQRYNINPALAYAIGEVQSTDVSPQWFDETATEPMFVQFKQRFSPPATTTRTINTIILTNHDSAYSLANYNYQNTGRFASAYVKLDGTCTQTSTQVLDIIYRVKWNLSQAVSGVSAQSMKLLAKHAAGVANAPAFIDFGYHTSLSTLGLAGEKSDAFTNLTLFSPRMPAYTFTYDAGPVGRRCNWTMDETQRNGYIIGSQVWGNDAMFGAYTWASILQKSTDSRIQPIHNHKVGSATPFMDVNFLASGSGTLTAGGTWTDPDYPKFVRINIKTNGNVGQSTYTYSIRPMFGFFNITYGRRYGFVPWFTAKEYSATTLSSKIITHNQVETVSGIATNNDTLSTYTAPHKIEKYNYTSVITYDLTGITYSSLVKNIVTNFDSVSTPALPVTQIAQVSVAPDGHVWVACNSTGLWKVHPINKTVSQAVVTGITTQSCYGVDIGRNGKIWAVMNGGVSVSSDNGSTWTTYNSTSTTAITMVGLTDDNWSTVAYIRADPSHADDRIAIVRKVVDIEPRRAIIWWSVANPVAAALIDTTFTSANFLRRNKICFNVSDNDSVWVGYFDNNRYVRLDFGLTTAWPIIEGGIFTLTETTTIKYGANDNVIEKSLDPGTYTCGIALFGSDPAPGSNKQCQIVTSSASTSVPSSLTLNEFYPYGFTPFGLGVYFEQNQANEDCLYVIASDFWPELAGEPGAAVRAALITPAGVITQVLTSRAPGSPDSPYPYFSLTDQNSQPYELRGHYRPCYMGNGVWTFSKDVYGYVDPTSSRSSSAGQVVWELATSSDPDGGDLAYISTKTYGWTGSAWSTTATAGKPTHTAPQELSEGITLSFANGAAGTSFIATDYYTFGVCNGLLKDNATTAQGSLVVYLAPLATNSLFSNNGVIGTIAGYAANTAITWANAPASGFTASATATELTVAPTTFGGVQVYSTQSIGGDFVVEWTGAMPNVWNSGTFGLGDQYGNIIWGLATENNATAPTTDTRYLFLQELGLDGRNVPTYLQPATPTDLSLVTSYKMERIGNTLNVYVNDILRHTSATAFVDRYSPIKVVHYWPVGTSGKYPVPKIVSNATATGVVVGTSATSTGKFDPAFSEFEHTTSSMSFTINGTPVAAIYPDGDSVPGVNEVKLSSSQRAIICNTADVGKTLTGTYSYTKIPNI